MNSKNQHTVISCKRCGAKFNCGSNGNNSECWCHDLPNTMALTKEAKSSEDCYCQQCLEEIINEKSKKS